jgi:hypothetical protein
MIACITQLENIATNVKLDLKEMQSRERVCQLKKKNKSTCQIIVIRK